MLLIRCIHCSHMLLRSAQVSGVYLVMMTIGGRMIAGSPIVLFAPPRPGPRQSGYPEVRVSTRSSSY